jgi:hypothetical protein
MALLLFINMHVLYQGVLMCFWRHSKMAGGRHLVRYSHDGYRVCW